MKLVTRLCAPTSVSDARPSFLSLTRLQFGSQRRVSSASRYNIQRIVEMDCTKQRCIASGHIGSQGSADAPRCQDAAMVVRSSRHGDGERLSRQGDGRWNSDRYRLSRQSYGRHLAWQGDRGRNSHRHCGEGVEREESVREGPPALPRQRQLTHVARDSNRSGNYISGYSKGGRSCHRHCVRGRGEHKRSSSCRAVPCQRQLTNFASSRDRDRSRDDISGYSDRCGLRHGRRVRKRRGLRDRGCEESVQRQRSTSRARGTAPRHRSFTPHLLTWYCSRKRNGGCGVKRTELERGTQLQLVQVRHSLSSPSPGIVTVVGTETVVSSPGPISVTVVVERGPMKILMVTVGPLNLEVTAVRKTFASALTRLRHECTPDSLLVLVTGDGQRGG